MKEREESVSGQECARIHDCPPFLQHGLDVGYILLEGSQPFEILLVSTLFRVYLPQGTQFLRIGGLFNTHSPVQKPLQGLFRSNALHTGFENIYQVGNTTSNNDSSDDDSTHSCHLAKQQQKSTPTHENTFEIPQPTGICTNPTNSNICTCIASIPSWSHILHVLNTQGKYTCATKTHEEQSAHVFTLCTLGRNVSFSSGGNG